MNEGDYAINDILMVTQPNSCRNAFLAVFWVGKLKKSIFHKFPNIFQKKFTTPYRLQI